MQKIKDFHFEYKHTILLEWPNIFNFMRYIFIDNRYQKQHLHKKQQQAISRTQQNRYKISKNQWGFIYHWHHITYIRINS